MLTSSALEPAPQSEPQASEGAFAPEIRKTWSILFEASAVVEMRAPKTRWKTVSGYFDNPDDLAAAAASLDGQHSIYVTLNPPDPALIARAENRAVQFAETTTSDREISRRRWVLVDFDPVRPTNISSTDAEHDAALARARDTRTWLLTEGVPDDSVVLCDSGGGAHLLLRVDLPNDERAKVLVERLLEAIAIRRGDHAVNVDLKTSNAARITKLYGTVAVKGSNTALRPHRRTAVLHAPATISAAPIAVLEKVAAFAPAQAERREEMSDRPHDIESLLNQLAEWVGNVVRKDWHNGAKLWKTQICPWNPEHTDWPFYLIQFPNGAVVARCYHNGCQGKEWRDFRALFPAETFSIPRAAEHPATGGHVLTDVGNSELFVEQHGHNVRYITDLKAWAVWDGVLWRLDAEAPVATLAKQTVRSMLAELAAKPPNPKELFKHWSRSEDASRIEAMIRLSQSVPDIAITQSALDSDPWLLNCLNGTLDLRTGLLRPHDRADLITKIAPVHYDPNATLELWDRFLAETTGGNAELARFLQRATGYTLTGQAGLEVLFFAYGSGATGKSTFLAALLGALGDYATTLNFGSLTSQKRDAGGPRSDVVRLRGMRMVASVEVENGQRLAESLVKSLTGGDKIVARGLYQKEIEFLPQFKLWLAANHQPEVSDDDDAVWRRILTVPFENVVPEPKRDEQVKLTLRDPAVAGPAILAWAVRGLLDWRANGFQLPEAVKAATRSYRANMDPLQDFWTECCIFVPGAWTAARDLWDAYVTWASDRGERPISQKELGTRLARRGCVPTKQQHQRGWKGVRLTRDDEVREAADQWDSRVAAALRKPAGEVYA